MVQEKLFLKVTLQEIFSTNVSNNMKSYALSFAYLIFLPVPLVSHFRNAQMDLCSASRGTSLSNLAGAASICADVVFFSVDTRHKRTDNNMLFVWS